MVTGSGQRPLFERVLSDFSDFLDEQHLVTAYDVKRGKPNPDPYLMGMQKAGTQPWETLVVENAPLGVQAGVAAHGPSPLPSTQVPCPTPSADRAEPTCCSAG